MEYMLKKKFNKKTIIKSTLWASIVQFNLFFHITKEDVSNMFSLKFQKCI